MGITLSRACRWTSVQGKGKLEFSSINQFILNEITQFVIDFAGRCPNESNYQFKTPLTYTSKDLTLSMFTGNYSTAADGSIESNDKFPDGVAHLTAKKSADGKSIDIKLSSFAQCAAVLKLAKEVAENPLADTRYVLENNKDPTSKILGDGYAAVERKDNTMNRLVDQMISQSKDSQQSEEKLAQLKIYIEIDQLDKYLLNASLKKVSE